MPAEAKKKTPEGAAAFTEYYFELIEYTTVTNDSAPIKGITTHGCGPCGKIVIDPADRNREIKAWNAGGAIDFTPVQARIDGAESALVTFKFDQEKLSIFNPGGVLAAEVPATKMPESGSIGLIYEKGWKTDSLSFVEDE